MNFDLLLNQNIKDICFDTVRISKLQKSVVHKNIIKFFIQFLISSKNVYISSFLNNRLKKFSACNDKYVLRKILVEMYVFLALCNKPTDIDGFLQFTKIKLAKDIDIKHLLKAELKGKREMNTILNYVCKLEKTNKEYLWSSIFHLVHDNSLKKQYVLNLFELYKMNANKELLFAAYRVLHILDLTYDITVYHKLIFQCMLKINYLYEDNEIKQDLFLKCLTYIPHENMSLTSNKFLVSYQLENKTITIENKSKINDNLYFEKVY
jgi:hypothetical protein